MNSSLFLENEDQGIVMDQNAKVRHELNQKIMQLEKLQKESERLDSEISKKRQTIDTFLTTGTISNLGTVQIIEPPTTPKTVQLTPKIASMAVSETNAEQDYYSLIDESLELIHKVPRNSKLRELLDKLSDLNQTLFQLRLQYDDLQNMDIPTLPLPSLNDLPEPDKKYYFTMDTDIVYEEEPSKPVTAKQKELEILNNTIEKLNDRIDMKTKALVRYTIAYDTNLKTMVTLGSSLSRSRQGTLDPNNQSTISLTTLDKLQRNIDETNLYLENDLGKIEDLKRQIKNLQYLYNEKTKENQMDIVGLVEEMKEMKKKSIHIEKRYNSLEKELEAFQHSGLNTINESSIIALEDARIEYEKKSQKLLEELQLTPTDEKTAITPAYLTRLTVQDNELNTKLAKVKVVKDTLKHKISAAKRKLGESKQRVPLDI